MKQKLMFLSWQTKKLLKGQGLKKRRNVPYSNARQIGVLYSANGDDKQRAVRSFITQLNQEGKHVKVLRYKPKVVVDAHEQPNTGTFGEEHLSFWGKLNNDDVADFVKAPFDFLFYLDDTLPHHLTKHVLVLSQAKCRVGCYAGQEASQFFELMIQPSKPGITSLTHDMLHYAKLIV